MNAVIYLDVPDWQIGQDVTVYFPDTMMKHSKCELLKEKEAVEPIRINGKRNHFIKCGDCNYDLLTGYLFCPRCGKAVKWE